MFNSTESDAQLVARTRRGRHGDAEAFNVLVSRWEKRLYNYLLRLLGGRPGFREDALDLCQDAFLKAYQSIGSLEDAQKFPGWLYRIAHNLAYSELRRPALMQSLEERFGGDEPEDRKGGECIPITRATAWQSPATGADRELELSVARALDSLPPEQREAIILKVYHGFLFHEIAEITVCPLGTVKSRIYSGFAQLRNILGQPSGQRSGMRAMPDRSR